MNKKIALALMLILLIFIVSLLNNEYDFVGQLTKVIENIDKEKVEKLAKTGETPTPEGPDWWIRYSMPSCYDPGNMEGIKEMRAVRVHWKELIKDGPFRGTYMAGENEIIYSGSFDGKNLTFTDKTYGKSLIKTTAHFSDNFSELQGKWEIENNLLNITGCQNGTVLMGTIEGKPMPQK